MESGRGRRQAGQKAIVMRAHRVGNGLRVWKNVNWDREYDEPPLAITR